MTVIPFCSENLTKIKKEAVEIQWLLNESWLLKDQNPSFKVGDLLDSFAKAMGYSGWGAIVVKNKDKRGYVPFSFKEPYHVTTIENKITNDLNLAPSQLIIATSLLYLGASSENEMFTTQEDQQDTNFDDAVVGFGIRPTFDTRNYRRWFTAAKFFPSLLYLSNEIATAAELDKLFPDLIHFLKKHLDIKDTDLIAFSKCLDHDDIIPDTGYLKVEYKNRTIYSPIYDTSSDEKEEDGWGLYSIYETYTEIIKDLGFNEPDYIEGHEWDELECNFLEKLKSGGVKFEIYNNKDTSIQLGKYDQYMTHFHINCDDFLNRQLYEISHFYYVYNIEFRLHKKEFWHKEQKKWFEKLNKFFQSYTSIGIAKENDTINDSFIKPAAEMILSMGDMYLNPDGTCKNPIVETIYQMPDEYYEAYSKKMKGI